MNYDCTKGGVTCCNLNPGEEQFRGQGFKTQSTYSTQWHFTP